MSNLAGQMPVAAGAPTRLWDLLSPIAADSLADGLLTDPWHRSGDARAHREEMLAQAQRDAEAVREAADADAAALRQNAERDAELLRADARQQGYAEGAIAARTGLEAELADAWNSRVSALQHDVQSVLDAFAAEREAVWLQTEADMITFALEIARKIVKVELTQNPAVLAEMIRHALRRVVDKENVRVRVNPDELDSARADRKDLQLVLDGARSLEIIDDRRIGRGGCVIETGAGTIDARIETQFNEIARALESATTPSENDEDDDE